MSQLTSDQIRLIRSIDADAQTTISISSDPESNWWIIRLTRLEPEPGGQCLSLPPHRTFPEALAEAANILATNGTGDWNPISGYTSPVVASGETGSRVGNESQNPGW